MSFRHSFTETKFFRAVVVAAILSVCVFFSPRFIMEPLRTVLSTVGFPLQALFSTVAFGLSDTTSFLGSIGELKSENERLLADNTRLLAENARYEAVAGENDELRRELEMLPRENYRLKPAGVIGRDTAGLGNWLTIDAGSFAGVTEGMPVIVYGGVLIGRVTEVFPQSARIMLLSNPDSLVSGITLEGDAQGIVKGEYGLGILLDMVLQDATLQAGHRVVTSGLGGTYPKNLLIGVLDDPQPTADHLYQRAAVTSPVDYSSLHYVFLIQESLTP
jgi:rod shape-determining protein MreC